MRSQSSIIELSKRNENNLTTIKNDSVINTFRSATAVDLRRHFAVKSVYTNSSSVYVEKKFNIHAAITYRLHAKTPIGNIKSPFSHLEGISKKKTFSCNLIKFF